MKVNYHTHTRRCHHAKGDVRDYVEEAIRQGFDILGMSDHGPYPDHEFGWHMSYSEVEDYVAEINELKKEKSGQIKLYAGLEIEYLPRYRNHYEKLLTQKGIEYLILGQHIFHYDDDAILCNSFGLESTEDCVQYAKMIAEALDTGLYSALAHPDLCMMGRNAWDANCDKALDIIIDAAVKHDMVLEVNANGFRRGLVEYPDGVRYPYPHKKFWQEIKKANIKAVVGSDCHEPELLWDESVEMAYKMLMKLGITPQDYLKNMQQ
ncbi:MAG: histidinol-phosphatase [Pseudobutyrivibrio sp.]|nr:histidinol-phosphatase [Pseudobutyrivibrio sp.]